jgi:hypothetical protein
MEFKEFKTYVLLLIAVCFSGCEKEIAIDYHEADMKYVVEGAVTYKGTTVRVSKTKPMNDNTTESSISNAIVVITAGDSINETIPYKDNGFYTSNLIGKPGVTYHIDVTLDGHHFTSYSTMQRMPVVNKFSIVRKKMLSQSYIFGDIRIQDLPNESNWYFVHIYRNGLGYRWAALSDETNPNKELQQLFGFFNEDSSDGKDKLHEGDQLRIVVRAIDQHAYDYLHSMEQMDNTGTNPIDNFTGGCLGYFSAHSEITEERIYHSSDIEDEDD